MMDEGYFVPRGEILNWLNDLLKVYYRLSLVESNQNLTIRIGSRILSSS
jgi:hypothetical protein